MQRGYFAVLTLVVAPLLLCGCSGAGGGVYSEEKAQKSAEQATTGYYGSPTDPSAMPASPDKAPSGAPGTPGAAPSATP